MTGALSMLSALTVLAGFWSYRPGPRRLIDLLPMTEVCPPRLTARTRRLALAGGVTVVTWFVWSPLAPVAGVGAWTVPVWRARRRRAGERGVVARAMPEVVDLFAVAVGAGLTVPLAVAAVGARVDGAFGVALRGATSSIAAGRRCADALDDVAADLGADARPLLDALRASERYGAPLSDALLRIAGEVRADRRRRAEEAARRVPVQLLFPLVTCVLPAFALLAVAPLLAGTLGSLRL